MSGGASSGAGSLLLLGRPRLVLSAVLALLLAGCTGGAAPEGEPLADQAAPDATPEPTPPPVVEAPPPRNDTAANGTAPPPPSPGPAPPSPAAPTPAAPPAPEERRFVVNQTLATRAAACSEASGCAAVAPPGDDGTRYEPDVGDAVLSYALALTWNATTELTASLVVRVETCDAHACATTATVAGTSPLVLTVPDAQGRGNPRILVSADPATPPEAPAEGSVVVQQPYMLEALFVTRAPADGAPAFAEHDEA